MQSMTTTALWPLISPLVRLVGNLCRPGHDGGSEEQDVRPTAST